MFGLVLAWLALANVGCANVDVDGLAERALMSPGNGVRLQHVMAKARRGETITIGAIGGSITQGAKATEPSYRYINIVTEWWRTHFPRATVEMVNAGVGATDSRYGALRVKRDLLSHRPDLVIVDFAVNDPSDHRCAETMEGLLRQILSQPNSPAIVLLFMMKESGTNAQPWQAPIGAYYGLPMVSYRDALWPEIEAGRLKWAEISPDDIHPNDFGMKLAAEFIVHLCAQTMKNLPDDAQLLSVPPVEKPLINDRFEHVKLDDGKNLQPIFEKGWTFDPTQNDWRSSEPGSAIEFEAPGQSISLTFYRLRGKMGRVKVQVDGGPVTLLDAWFPGTWGGYHDTVMIADRLPAGMHRIRVELLKERNPESQGYEFRLHAIGSAGVTYR
jgi:lysophospholipase L1-like esterase